MNEPCRTPRSGKALIQQQVRSAVMPAHKLSQRPAVT